MGIPNTMSRADINRPLADTNLSTLKLKPVRNMALRCMGYKGKRTGHGFRHIASTILNEHGFDENHVEAQLSHAKAGVAGVYNKAKYLKQRRIMMLWYADHLDRLKRNNTINIKPGGGT